MFNILMDTLANAPDASQKRYWLELRVRGQIVQFSSFNEFLAYWVKLPSLHSVTVLERNVFGRLFNFDFNSRFGRFILSERKKPVGEANRHVPKDVAARWKNFDIRGKPYEKNGRTWMRALYIDRDCKYLLGKSGCYYCFEDDFIYFGMPEPGEYFLRA